MFTFQTQKQSRFIIIVNIYTFCILNLNKKNLHRTKENNFYKLCRRVIEESSDLKTI